jgi:hypothetical protein
MEMEMSLQLMMARLLAEMKADIIANIKASREEFLAILDRWESYEKGTTTCQTEMTSCLEEMDATRLVNPGAAGAAVEWQELREKEINVDNISSLEDRYREQRLIVQRRRGERSGPKTVLGPGRSSLPPASVSYVTPSLPFEKEKFVRSQARTTLLEEPSEERRS